MIPQQIKTWTGWTGLRRLSLLFLLCATSWTAAAPNIPLVAVMPLDARKIDTEDARTLSDALADALHGTAKVRVMERAQMDQILKEQGFQQSGVCDASECAVKVGKILGIDRIVVGSVGRIGGTFTMSLREVDVNTGEVLATATRNQKGEIDEVLTRLVPEVARQLVGMLPPPVAQTMVEKPVEPVVVPEKNITPAKKKSRWGWWLAGGTVVTGAAVGVAVWMSTQQESQPKSSVEAVW